MALNIISIGEAKAKTVDTELSVVGKVVEVGKLEEYEAKDGGARKYGLVTIADATGFTLIRVYLWRSIMSLVVGSTFGFLKLRRKTGLADFWAVSTSKIIPWARVEVPQEIIDQAISSKKKEDPNSPRKLHEALASTNTSTIKAKVVQSSPVKYVRDGELPMKFLGVKDSDRGSVKLALFGEDSLREYTQGDVVAITNTYKYKKTDTLSTKTTSSVEFLPSDSLDVFVSDADKLDDDDFKNKEDQPAQTTQFTVLGVASAFVYLACPYPGCRNKKLAGIKCPLCQRTSLNNPCYHCNASLLVQHEETITQHTLFKPDLQKLLDLPELNTLKGEGQLSTFLTDQLPFNGRGSFCNGKLAVASRKRPLE